MEMVKKRHGLENFHLLPLVKLNVESIDNRLLQTDRKSQTLNYFHLSFQINVFETKY